jgi:small subunit ribosomal protein S11
MGEQKVVEAKQDEAKQKPTDADAKKASAGKKRKKAKRSVPFGHIHVLASFNNTIVTFADQNGKALVSSSAGACGFRGSKKGTAYAAQVAAGKVTETAKQQFGLRKANVFVKGVGLGRDAAVRSLAASDIAIELITDVTPIAHGGCRPRKARRV